MAVQLTGARSGPVIPAKAGIQAEAAEHWRADRYGQHASFVPALGASLLTWLQPQRGERVLDLGCGDGVLTQALVDAGAEVLGVDASPALVDAARRRGIDARIVDGQALRFDAEFDAVFSNAALHWMKRDPAAVIGGVCRALKAGGRFVAEMGGEGNVDAIRAALHEVLAAKGFDPVAVDPWYFPSVEEYEQRLRHVGFTVQRIETYPRPTPLPTDVRGWLETFAQPFLAAVPAAQRDAVLDEVSERLRPQLRDASGLWTADYVRLRFIAYKN
ncbi:MAG TPA: methyltransferase domain-containing protein [Fontimonas sp.]